jgi:hypothetical protein
MKEYRTQWQEHVERTDNTRILKEVFIIHREEDN